MKRPGYTERSPAQPSHPCPRKRARPALQVWIAPGMGVGEDFVSSLEQLANSNSELTMLAILAVFAVVHSGLAYLRPYGERTSGCLLCCICLFLVCAVTAACCWIALPLLPLLTAELCCQC